MTEPVMIITAFGERQWYIKNMTMLHREDGPALENIVNGTFTWYYYGMVHRINGPAIEWSDGSEEWYQNGKRHRLDGPAMIHTDGSTEWWVDDNRHRLDGPAYEYFLGKTKAWFIDGNYIPDEWVKENTADPMNIAKDEQTLMRLRWS